MASEVFLEVGIVVVASALVALVAHFLKQPPIIAYIVAGFVVGPVLGLIHPGEALEAFSTMGIAFLLFLVGLHLNSRVIRDVGKTAVAAGVSQVAFTAFLGYLISLALGFPFIESLYIGLALAFSSTIIVIKLLSDKGDMDSLYGKASVGILLVQDFITIALLVLIAGFQTQASIPVLLSQTAFKILLLSVVAYAASRFFLPAVLDRIASSQELLFLSGIAWMFTFTGLAVYLELSVEIGAFLAGVTMAPFPYTFNLASKIRPLRDFFIVLFFIALGTDITLASMSQVAVPAAILSLFVLVANPLVVIIILGAMGYKKRASFMTALTVSQISEFSLIIIALGMTVGHVSQPVVTMITLVGITTIAGSVYMVSYGDRLYEILSPHLDLFERSDVPDLADSTGASDYSIVLAGIGRMGRTLLRRTELDMDDVLLVDYDPESVREFTDKGFNCVYADVSDTSILQDLEKHNPSLIVSTVPDFQDNMRFIHRFKDEDTRVFVRASQMEDAQELYDAGADLVIMPHFLGGEMAAMMVLDAVEGDDARLENLRHGHLSHIEEELVEGDE